MTVYLEYIWRTEFVQDGVCVLCNNSGYVKNRECICPTGRGIKRQKELTEQESRTPRYSDDMPLHMIPMGVRMYRALTEHGKMTVAGDFYKLPESEIIRIPNMGKKSTEISREVFWKKPNEKVSAYRIIFGEQERVYVTLSAQEAIHLAIKEFQPTVKYTLQPRSFLLERVKPEQGV